jgi:hypothetical protein
VFEHHGGDHYVWLNPRNGQESTIPRHREVKPPIVRSVCKQLEIPAPRKVT